MKLTDIQIIDLLGGTGTVAKLCEVSAPAVAQWKAKGIPKDKLMFLSAAIELKTKGLINRKSLFPKNYKFIWPELN